MKIFSYKRIGGDTFWWDTLDGLRWSSTTVYKLQIFKWKWFIEEQNDRYKDPRKHPEYEERINAIIEKHK